MSYTDATNLAIHVLLVLGLALLVAELVGAYQRRLRRRRDAYAAARAALAELHQRGPRPRR